MAKKLDPEFLAKVRMQAQAAKESGAISVQKSDQAHTEALSEEYMEVLEKDDDFREDRIKSLATTNAAWRRLDYEVINAAFKLELNPCLSPLILHKVVKDKLSSMTREEKQAVPEVVWSLLSGLDIVASGGFLTEDGENVTIKLPSGKSSKIRKSDVKPLNVAWESPGESVIVQSVGHNIEYFFNQIRGNLAWQTMFPDDSKIVKRTHNTVSITNDTFVFYELHQVKTIINNLICLHIDQSSQVT